MGQTFSIHNQKRIRYAGTTCCLAVKNEMGLLIKALLGALVDWARTTGTKVVPLCPFAKHEFDNTREYDDIRA